MTKKHFIAFAQQAAQLHSKAKIATQQCDLPNAVAFTQRAVGIEDAVCCIAPDFNPNFNEEKFRASCRKG